MSYTGGYGDTYSGVQGAAMQDRRMREEALQRSYELLLDTLKTAGAQQVSANKAGVGNILNLAGMYLGQQNADVVHKDAKVNADRNFELSKDYFDWQKKQTPPAASVNYDRTYRRAVTEAENGNFDPTLHPGLEPADLAQIKEHNDAVRAQYEEGYNTAKNAAGVLNRHQALQKSVASSQAYLDKAPLWDLNPSKLLENYTAIQSEKANIEDYQKGLKELAPHVARITGDKKASALVTYDPQSDSFVPAIAEPRWLRPAKQPADKGPAQGGGRVSSPDFTPQDLIPVASHPELGTLFIGPPMPSNRSMTNAYQGDTNAPQTKTATAGKRDPWIYERANYWAQRGLSLPEASAKAYQEYHAAFQ